MSRVVLIGLAVICQICFGSTTTTQQKKLKYSAIDLVYANISSNLDDWNNDLAIMFHVSWCKYCKQLAPSFDQIAAINSQSKDLIVGKFDCEIPVKHAEVCKAFGVDKYPSVYFIGYGKLNQGPDGKLIGKNSLNPRIAKFTADMYPEAILDWISMLNGISKAQRSWTDFASIFGGNSRLGTKLQKMRSKMDSTEAKLAKLTTDMSVYQAKELFESLTDQGDPFPALHSAAPTEDNYVLRVCVVEMAAEFCKYFSKESYCSMVPSCNKKDMAPEECRPAVCPFKDGRGCVVVSQCLSGPVLDEYRKVLKV